MRSLKPLRRFLLRCRETLWMRRNVRCTWADAWMRAGWWV